jgi:hypothetical protein
MILVGMWTVQVISGSPIRNKAFSVSSLSARSQASRICAASSHSIGSLTSWAYDNQM